MVFFLLHAAVLWVSNSSLCLLPILTVFASANDPCRDSRARFDDGSVVCVTSLCSRQILAQWNFASSERSTSRFYLKPVSLGKVQFHRANPDVIRCLYLPVGKTSMDNRAVPSDLLSQSGIAVHAGHLQFLGQQPSARL